ncbi:MAG TPA: sigma 54-interacting transcriptional regulator [Vicinamibacterales bacterium]|nr:sigma 54-interacting transcriptional regulator [Vicinamibacterales bacterium]
MELRLVVTLDGGHLRVPLSDGEHTVGSDPSCTIVLAHPSVSRHHARLIVRGDVAEIEDLDSSNGVIVGSRRIKREVLSPGQLLYFGRVSAVLEHLPAGDVEVGVRLQGSNEIHPTPAPTEPAQATVMLAPVERFTIDHLPHILRAASTGADIGDVARLAGQALLTSLACQTVEVARLSRSGEGLLFDGRSSAGDGRPSAVVEHTGPWVLVRATFADPRTASLFSPVIESVAWLIGLTSPSPTRPPTPRPAVLPLPDPPSIVESVVRIYLEAARVATGDVSVLITGESGTGKEILARYVHAASGRARGPFVALNCAALPRDLLESELFGIERGVATGVEARPGKFELADGGTLFLDEIGDMAPETQARLLRVLQEREVFRLGGRDPRPARIRVVAATNRDVAAGLADGRFREDLYHRIATWVVELPPLRERRADIPNLAAFFLAREAARHGRRVGGISRAAVEVLRRYEWPGNIRQLENEISRAVLFLEQDDLLDTIRLSPAIASGRAAVEQSGRLEDRLAAVERREIADALERSGGDVEATAETLGMSRATLYRRMKTLGIEPG